MPSPLCAPVLCVADHPPDWDPRKQSRAEHAAGVTSKADKWKAHPLRERAKKLHTEGILTVRFEMPFNVRCTGCGNHIAKGVRFNAEKKTIGAYYTTKVLSFRMPCHCEDGTSRTDRHTNLHFIEVHTDPKNAEYVVASGAVRVAEPSLLTPAELGVEAALDASEAALRGANPFYKLETEANRPGGAAAAKRKPWLAELQDVRDADWHDDYGANAALRRAHRAKRADVFLTRAHDEARGVRVARVPEHPDDASTAASAAPLLRAKRRRSEVARSAPRHQLLMGSIFSPTPRASSDGAAAAVEQQRLLAVRRERGMQIAPSAPKPGSRGKPAAACSAGLSIIAAPHRPQPAHVEPAVPTSRAIIAGASPPLCTSSEGGHRGGGAGAPSGDATRSHVPTAVVCGESAPLRGGLVAYSDSDSGAE